MPYYPIENDTAKHGYNNSTAWEKLVSEYTGLNLFEIEELDYIDYKMLMRDAFIHKMSQTKEGVEYLNNAWRLEQTKPDREALRSKYGNK